VSFQETVDFLYSQLPMYQRIGASAYKKDLTNIIALCKKLGNPHEKLKTIHVAGTNGKGSTSHTLAAIYQKNGYKTGLYTSPHLVEFTERIKINGQEISQQFVIDFTEKIKPLLSEINPSFFEITVAMAFEYFQKESVDIAIIETGLGGRLDSTNIINPMISIITTVGFDHMDMLGDSLEKIASEKAGIIKKSIPVVIGNCISNDALNVIQQKAITENAPLIQIDTSIYVKSDLKGDFQQNNLHLALKAIELLQNIFPLEEELINQALLEICSLTNFQGRWQTILDNPLIICDVGHNEEGIQVVLREIEKTGRKPFFVLGFVKEKDLEKIAPLFPKEATYCFVTPSVIRGLPAAETKKHFEKAGIGGMDFPSIFASIENIMQNIHFNSDNSLIFVGGSNFTVSDFLREKQKVLQYFE
jgi:dihydrofolate synthase / folylpolyglutamate synthase